MNRTTVGMTAASACTKVMARRSRRSSVENVMSPDEAVSHTGELGAFSGSVAVALLPSTNSALHTPHAMRNSLLMVAPARIFDDAHCPSGTDGRKCDRRANTRHAPSQIYKRQERRQLPISLSCAVIKIRLAYEDNRLPPASSGV